MLERDRFSETMSWLTGPAAVRWIWAPLVTALVLLASAAAFAREARAYDELLCPPNSKLCYNMGAPLPVVIVPTLEPKSGKKGLIMVNCAYGIAMSVDKTWLFDKSDPLEQVCQTIGNEE